jgi:hypothetical protein
VPKFSLTAIPQVVIELELVLGDKSNATGYFQRYDGVIEVSKYSKNSWKNGPDSQDIDTTKISINGQNLTARDGTPLMALSYARAGEQIWEIVYVAADDYLVNLKNSNITQEWTPGTLRSGNFKVSTSPHTGLSAVSRENNLTITASNSSTSARTISGLGNHMTHRVSELDVSG